MQRLLKTILFSFIFLVATQSISSQENTPTQIIKGVEYYIYQIQAGEGLYSISRKFNVSQKEIILTNPKIKKGLIAGEKIFIPKKNKVSKNTLRATSSSKKAFILHKVTAGQTLFSISQKHKIRIEDILKFNPEINKVGLRLGATIKIPIKNKTQKNRIQNTVVSKNITPTLKSIRVHKVDAKETLYSIAREYKVTVKQILELNPNIKENFIKEDMTLLIPSSSKSKFKKRIKKHFKIAYLLPFLSNSQEVNPTSIKFIQFYMGALLAIKHNKNKDIQLDILTYDIEKSETKLYEVLNNVEMQKVDLIFGPAYTLQIPILTDFAKRRKIFTVIPFSSNVQYIESNPYVFQFNPNENQKEEMIADFLQQDFATENILFVKTKFNYNFQKINFIKQKLFQDYIPYKMVKEHNIKNNLLGYRKNIIVFDTEKYSIEIADILAYLYDLSSIYDIAVIGSYNWKGKNGKKPKMYYISPFNNVKTGTKYYEKEYRKFYANKKPLINPRFDLLGYDLTNCFISEIKKNRLNLKNKTTLLYKGVQSDFIFKKESNQSGYVNQKLYLIEDEAKKQ